MTLLWYDDYGDVCDIVLYSDIELHYYSLEQCIFCDIVVTSAVYCDIVVETLSMIIMSR